MDRKHQERITLIRTVAAAALVLLLMQSTAATDALSWLTRPAVLTVIHLLGGQASQNGNILMIGQLRVPWSRDCAGFDVLLVLWGLILWTHRQDPISRRFWLRMLFAVPAAVAANIARVITIIGWREVFFPAVESPQMHYFIGFLWLLPLLALFIPRHGRPFLSWATETTMLAAALSLVAPQAAAPGGLWVTISALIVLAGHQWRRLRGPLDIALAAGWVAAAVFITGSAMESLWLPWLLACPWCYPRRWILHPAVLLLPASIPLVSMNHPWVAWIGVAGGVWLLYRTRVHVARRSLSPQGAIFLFVMMLFPFLASTLGPALIERKQPPAGLMAQKIDPNSYLVRFAGQPPQFTLTWNTPNGSGRHHTLPVCLRYRGITTKPVARCPGVESDTKHWLAEAFLMPDGRLLDYRGYLRASFLPFSSPGIHLIAGAPKESLSPEQFRQEADAYFERIARLAQGTP